MAEKWTAFHIYKLPHKGNRSSNRVESSHSSLKRYIRSSSGTIVLTTEKIDQWYKRRVSVKVIFYNYTDLIHISIIVNRKMI